VAEEYFCKKATASSKEAFLVGAGNQQATNEISH
jgi:hypothetical protein